MERVHTYIRIGQGLIFIFAAGAWIAECFRWTALLFVAACLVYAAFSSPERRGLIVIITAVGFLGLSIAPIDITFSVKPGLPHVVRYIFGYPTDHAKEMARRGEAILGGCIVHGYEPKWLIVW